MSSERDWDEVLAKFNGKQDTRKPSTFEVGVAIGAIATFSVISAITALCLMVANMVAVVAWPDITSIAPGVGFYQAFILSCLWWVMFFMKAVVVTVLRDASANR